MSNNYIEKPIKSKKKKNNKKKTKDKETKKVYNTTNVTSKISRTKVNDWKMLENKCELFKTFVNGERRLHHEELFGLSLSLIYLDGGEKRLLETIEKFPALYNKEKDKNWAYWLNYNKKQLYKPKRCDEFCPFKDTCKHYRNMRDTVVPGNSIYVLGNDIEYIDVNEGYKIMQNEIMKGVW